MAGEPYATHEYDVIVIGAGGAGLRAAIDAHLQGVRTALVCKSLLGKAHTVMAEGGIAAAMGNVWKEDNWQVHFRDTMRGGKMLNNWRMAQLHAQESPDRVLELEEWGALFDRTKDGLISQRDFGGHRYARLAHVGDRTGLEMIRTLQQHAVSLGIDVFMECNVQRLLQDGDRVCGAVGYWRPTGDFVVFKARAVVLATGGVGKSWKFTSNSWECTGDGIALALEAGADLIDMECIQFHPTGMVWPPSVRGILVTEGVRGDGGTLKNAEGVRFMFNYIPEYFKGETADNEQEADAWYEDKKNNRRTPDLLPRDEVARAINTEVKQGRGSPHGGVFLDIHTRRSADYIRKRLPSMYHQFKELAGVDITREAMEVGPTCHYIMGGVRVDADSAASGVPGLFAAGEVAGGMHGANRLGGNSLSDLLVFGRRAGLYAAQYAKALAGRPAADGGQVDAAIRSMLAPLESMGNENPYAIHADLQECMQALVGIIRTEGELKKALEEIAVFKQRLTRVRRGRRARLQPGLASCPRPRGHAGGVGGVHPGRARAQGEPGRAHPRRLPDGGRPVRQAQRGDPAPRRTLAVALEPLPEMPRRAQGAAPRAEVMATEFALKVWRGDRQRGAFQDYRVPVEEGMVVLDVIHRIQATQAPDLAVRWNCKAGKCGSCSAEINGKPRLMCMTRMDTFAPGQPIAVAPMRTFPLYRDLVTDVAFNFEKAKTIPTVRLRPKEADGTRRMMQEDVERSQEFRKCIECFLCQDVCHVIRDHEENKPAFAGPRFLMRIAELEMHPLDTHNRLELARVKTGLGYCNITKCCTEVCPEHIHITDNALIPLKERVVTEFHDPVMWVVRKLSGH